MLKRKEVYKLTDIAEIRFKPNSITKTATTQKLDEVKGWTNKIIQLASQKLFRTSNG